MNRTAFNWTAIAFTIAVCGCGSNPSETTVTTQTHVHGNAKVTQQSTVTSMDTSADVNAVPEGPFPAPDLSKASELALVSDDGTRIHVGDEAQAFKTAFPRSAQTSRSLNDLPPGATPDHWSVNGWEYDNASRGIGSLLYDGKIAMAMRQYDDVTTRDVSSEVGKYTSLIPAKPQKVEGKHVNYWFWQDEPVTLMICAFTNDAGHTNLTTALGDSAVMARLRMDVVSAQQDRTAVERIYGAGFGPNSAVHPG
jgi:hypothetical protein